MKVNLHSILYLAVFISHQLLTQIIIKQNGELADILHIYSTPMICILNSATRIQREYGAGRERL